MPDFREFTHAAMCSTQGSYDRPGPVTSAHDTEAQAEAEAARHRDARRVAVVWCVGEVSDATNPRPAPTTHGQPSEAGRTAHSASQGVATTNHTAASNGERP